MTAYKKGDIVLVPRLFFLNPLRMASIICSSDCSPAEQGLGYSNMSRFAAAFRKKYGINPGEYVKSIPIE